MDAAIVEFDSLADAVRAATENNDLFAVAGCGFVFGTAGAFVAIEFVGRLEVGRVRFVFCGAGVDALVDRVDAQRVALRRHLGLGFARQGPQACVRKPHPLQGRKSLHAILAGRGPGPALRA